jgi:methylthioribose-1-phosphate isomerase
MSRLKTIEWTGNKLVIIDQTRLPTELIYEDVTSVKAMYDAIKILKVRGAPAIGIAGAFGAYLSIEHYDDNGSKDAMKKQFFNDTAYIESSRPTAVNLSWAVRRMNETFDKLFATNTIAEIKKGILLEAIAVLEQDRETGRAIGAAGYELLKDKNTILTHCNAGGLATAEYGTALAPVYIGAENGKVFNVFSDETRPLLQGSRITAFELQKAGIPVTVICDNMAATVMARGKIDAVIVGADRISANGDTANKIGTYGVAILAKEHNIPFYVAAPFSTFDLSLTNGSQIPIEERESTEVTCGFGKQTAPSGVDVFNPAFDVTPAKYITAFITDKGVVYPPFTENLKKVLG